MRAKVLLQPLLLLGMALGTETRDETPNETTTTEDGLFLTQYHSDNRLNNTAHATRVDYKTAGNSFCRPGQTCGYQEGKRYSFCYVDYSNNWDYCCTGPCDYHGKSYMWCLSGYKWQYCGDAGYLNIDGIPCYHSHPCGMHQEASKESDYWCYVDHKLSWNRCCAPSSKCDYHGLSYKWCYTGYKKDTDWYECK
ncbi:hypothetical protein ACJMK2_018282 [Sinanodonta woodiana]|uniref:Uncharacterized protein n=2 Tax=Sinanodonta woodiana TaxID=1069815 RepID=A0ABD3UD04_SINWO